MTSTTSIQDLEAFWDQKIPSLPITLAGKTTAQGALIYSFTNPDGGIIAGADPSTGQVSISIALGTSS